MRVIELPTDLLREAARNPNQVDDAMLTRLKVSLSRFGVLENLVVRHIPDGYFEVVGGNHRLRLLKDLAYSTAPCVVIHLEDAGARLLAQALNRIEGTDDLALKAELVSEVLKRIPQEDVVRLLPETAASLQSLAALGEADLSLHLEAWERGRAARLNHMIFQLTQSQLQVVEEALDHILPEAKMAKGDSPNTRGTALYLLSRAYLRGKG